MTIGDALRKRRKEMGLSLLQVAKRAGVSYQAIGSWERGDRKLVNDNAEAICKALDMELVIRPKPRDRMTAQMALDMLDVDLGDTDHVDMSATPIIDTEHRVIGHRIRLEFNTMFGKE